MAQAFVKFLGGSGERLLLSDSTREEVDSAECQWALCYSSRPGRVEEGDVIFIGRFTSGPNDCRVFGRAKAMAHVEGRDEASEVDLARRPWKNDWPYYIRVYGEEFVDGTMENAISLNELMDDLGSNAFASTQRNAARGEGNTDPRRAYRQQPDVELSPEGFDELSKRLEAAFQAHGRIRPKPAT